MATVLITGANRGIGLELCRQLSERGDKVIALCRKPSPELEALGVRLFGGVDVTDRAALEAASQGLGDTTVDVLINNAGILESDTFDSLDFDQIRRHFEVNTLGALLVTSIMQSHLVRGSKIIIMTSRMGSIDDNGSGSYYAYRMSKAALNMAGVNLAHDFRGKGIAVAILHPGMVATEMTGRHGIPVSESAEGLVARIDQLQLGDSGSFWHANGERLPW
ncbi:MAG: SDR family oxidoreductase [Deltaproteobacteria bacterium]|nr:SDR family oxidoreductase [Deltaproteobacteria bacterium]MBW1876234.1 SDR family oxidoreductase [Deltaproteobacteria bacterium]MBW2161301.1 SDR family oxidoreductase [Deltaproteobacteria bacterium]MBW2215298.1 SDR family oxidoreductase [Deltaproteobacteria bacterium]MBW2587565.1 SDR family oxidoreductase [Deltaproteobacteria bacterium]